MNSGFIWVCGNDGKMVSVSVDKILYMVEEADDVVTIHIDGTGCPYIRTRHSLDYLEGLLSSVVRVVSHE
jgi:hypothetical protein